jgi:hypothetical protein
MRAGVAERATCGRDVARRRSAGTVAAAAARAHPAFKEVVTHRRSLAAAIGGFFNRATSSFDVSAPSGVQRCANPANAGGRAT